MNQVLKCDSPFFKAAAPKIDHPFALYLRSKSYIKTCKITTKSLILVQNLKISQHTLVENRRNFRIVILRENLTVNFRRFLSTQILIFGVKIQIH